MNTREAPLQDATAVPAGEEPLPLTGVRVLDLGHVFQGPYATFLMALAGAEVIKIEAPKGDMSRARGRDGDYPFKALNGCKKGIVLNLKSPRGKELLLELAKSADVLVENFAPPVMPRLGLGADVFMKANPRLIYASASGFGSTGPYADKLALDLTIQAMSGLMSTTGEKGGRPLKAGVPVADFMSGTHLYGAVVTALFQRERTGRGRVLEVSMLESLFATLLPSAGHVYSSGKVPNRTGNRHVADSYVPFDTFEAADGWVAVVAATDEHWVNLTRAMGRQDLHDDQSLRGLHARIARIEELTDAISAWTGGLTRDQVVSICHEYHVPSAPVRNLQEVLADPHLRARGFLTEHPSAKGPIALPHSPMRYAGSDLMALRPSPGLGQDTEQVLHDLCGLTTAELAELRRDGVI